MEHTRAPIENEIKLRVTGGAQAVELLESLGFRLTAARVFESNELFDTPDSALRSRGELIRLRTSGGVALLTFKSPDLPGPHKRREEIETRVDDAAALRAILERLGFRVLFRYEKYRSEYRRENEAGVVTLDETPVGTFMELEGAPDWIDHVAQELGFSSADYILSSYGRLYLEHCAAHGQDPTDMLFHQEIHRTD